MEDDDMSKKRKEVKTWVKPHKRSNPNSPGEHQVEGHYRKVGEKTNVDEHWRKIGGSRRDDLKTNETAINLMMWAIRFSDSAQRDNKEDGYVPSHTLSRLDSTLRNLKYKGIVSDDTYEELMDAYDEEKYFKINRILMEDGIEDASSFIHEKSSQKNED